MPFPYYLPGISGATAVPGPHTPAEPELGPNGEVSSLAFVNRNAGINRNLSNQLHETLIDYGILNKNSCFYRFWETKFRKLKKADINFLSEKIKLNAKQKKHFYYTDEYIR